jgi:hypothetical protein
LYTGEGAASAVNRAERRTSKTIFWFICTLSFTNKALIVAIFSTSVWNKMRRVICAHATVLGSLQKFGNEKQRLTSQATVEDSTSCTKNTRQFRVKKEVFSV